MNSRHQDEWSDREILTALDLRDHEKWTRQAIGNRMGRSKNAVIGMFGRIDAQIKKHDADGNQNGTMPRKWWKR